MNNLPGYSYVQRIKIETWSTPTKTNAHMSKLAVTLSTSTHKNYDRPKNIGVLQQNTKYSYVSYRSRSGPISATVTTGASTGVHAIFGCWHPTKYTNLSTCQHAQARYWNIRMKALNNPNIDEQTLMRDKQPRSTTTG